MHIKELIIDGFKSYANRTVISGWDQGMRPRVWGVFVPELSLTVVAAIS